MPLTLDQKSSKKIIFFAITAIVVFFRIFQINLSSLGDSWLPGVIIASGGILGVAFVYLLARELFNWQIASIAAFFTGISAWHVAISRETLWASWILNFFVLALYFLWKGMRGHHRCNFIFSGLFLGLSLYLSSPFYVPLIIVLLAILAYLHLLKKDFGREQYLHSRNFLIKGFVWIVVLSLAVFIVLRFWSIFDWSFGQTKEVVSPYALSLVMVVLLATGLFRSLLKLIRSFKRHGHFSAVQIIILSWFFLGLFSEEAIFALPVILILSAEGCWWFFSWLKSWYGVYDKHPHEASLVSSLAITLFLAGLTLLEFRSYFGF
ncbi:MAG: hypothetical protein HYT63_02940 [Candidatus Yanofskybacteria bacterium]|nr:hypothetical protein [Candidatus Yanofskybacteria bacterium]